MSKNIEIKYKWTKQLALTSAYDIYIYELKNSNKKFIGWFFIAMLQFGVVGAFKHNSYGFLILATIGLTYWYGLRWPLRKYFINKTFDKSPLANKQIDLIAKENGIYFNDNLEVSYLNISKFIQLDNAIVIYHNQGTIYIPNNSFKNKEDRDIFKNYLKNK